MVSDEALIAIGLHYPDISELVRAEMIRTAEQNPSATREDFIADVARHLMNQIEPEMPDHPDHVDCADACGLAVTHDGACLDRPGGRVVCDESNHVEQDPDHHARRFRLRDKDGDIWHFVEGAPDTFVHSPGGAPTYMGRAQIERVYGPVREEDIT